MLFGLLTLKIFYLTLIMIFTSLCTLLNLFRVSALVASAIVPPRTSIWAISGSGEGCDQLGNDFFSPDFQMPVLFQRTPFNPKVDLENLTLRLTLNKNMTSCRGPSTQASQNRIDCILAMRID